VALEELNFDDLARKKERRVMACGFYELLQLALKDFIILIQVEGTVIVRPTERLKNISLT